MKLKNNLMAKYYQVVTAILLVLQLPLYSNAQTNKISVTSFQCDENDVTAQTYPVRDQNNNKCALIIVSNVENGGFKFSFGNAFSKVEEKKVDGAKVYWVYVQEGVKSISITNSDDAIDALTNYYFPERIQKAKTYRMELATVFSGSNNSKQYLEFKVSPTNASVEVEGVPWRVDAGYALQVVKFGTYNYRVSAPGYYTEAGQIVVNDKDKKQTLSISLTPNYGWLNISGADLSGADIYIDGARQSSYNRIQLTSGTHQVKITKPYYALYEVTVDIKDGETTPLTPTLTPTAAIITMKVDNDADIYIDGKRVATGQWSGKLAAGSYQVECIKPNYITSRQVITISDINESRTISLKSPTPIFGSLSAESTPRGATVTVDREVKGVTPLFIDNVLTGDHTVEFIMDGYQTQKQNVTVKENEYTKVSAELNNKATFTIATNRNDASLFIDGKLCTQSDRDSNGRTVYQFDGKVGTYNIKLSANGSNTVEKSIYAEDGENFYFPLKRELIHPSAFYVAIGMGYEANDKPVAPLALTLGGYISRFNIEAYLEFIMAPLADTDRYSDNYYRTTKLRGGARVGYGFATSSRFQVTPQLGLLFTKVAESGGRTQVDGAHVLSGTIGARLYLHAFSHFGISLTPEYAFPMSKSTGYKILSDRGINQYGTGFNATLSFVLTY
jgi:hypothetical protein